jgi:hypothetical protein
MAKISAHNARKVAEYRVINSHDDCARPWRYETRYVLCSDGRILKATRNPDEQDAYYRRWGAYSIAARFKRDVTPDAMRETFGRWAARRGATEHNIYG